MRYKDPELMNRIKQYISEYYLENAGATPTITQIANAMDVVRSTAYNYLVAMDKEGMIEYRNGDILIKEMDKIMVDSEQVDAVGDINCGEPSLEEENLMYRTSLPTAIFGKGPFYILKAKGDSMVDAGVDDGDVRGSGCIPQELPGNQQTDAVENHAEQHNAHDVEVGVHQSGAPGVAVGAHGGQQGSDGGADVLPQNDGKGGAEGDGSGGAEALQDTHGGGGGLNQRREGDAHQNPQQGIGEGHHQLGKPALGLQEGHGVAHDLHAGHQTHEAQQDGADALVPLFLGEHIQKDTHGAQQGSQGGGLENLHQQAVTLQCGQGQNPGCDGGAHIGAHNHADGLPQGHNSRVDEAHHHDSGGGGGLNHGGHRHAQQEAFGHIGAHFRQNGLQLAACQSLQRGAHDVHAEEEQGKSSQQGDDLHNIKGHIFLHSLPKTFSNSNYMRDFR